MNKIGTKWETIDTLHQTNFRIKKHLGQNFLVDQNILDKIIEVSNIDKTTCVIEVGPGFGALTEKLCQNAKKVLAYEIDKELIPILKNKLKGTSNLILLNQDILNTDIDKDIEHYFENEMDIIVCSNLPYYITTPILMRFLETSKRVSKLILMMQTEVARRITSKPNTKDYNALSIVIDYRSVATYLFKVPKTVFIPTPKVDSAIVQIEVRKEPVNQPINEPFFFKFVHNCFAQRRKTLINNLLSAYPEHTRIDFENILTKHNLNLSIRAEAIESGAFVNLCNDVVKVIENRN